MLQAFLGAGGRSNFQIVVGSASTRYLIDCYCKKEGKAGDVAAAPDAPGEVAAVVGEVLKGTEKAGRQMQETVQFVQDQPEGVAGLGPVGLA